MYTDHIVYGKMNAPKYNKRYTYWFFILYLGSSGSVDYDVVVRNASRNNNIQCNRYINEYIYYYVNANVRQLSG